VRALVKHLLFETRLGDLVLCLLEQRLQVALVPVEDIDRSRKGLVGGGFR
jgi:hypothetical protein